MYLLQTLNSFFMFGLDSQGTLENENEIAVFFGKKFESPKNL